MEEDNLFPEDYEEETIDEDDLEDDEPIGYRPGVAFAWNPGDFVRDGRNWLQEASGVESWQQWCMNCLQTEQYKHLAYDDDFGINLDEIFSSSTREEAESNLTRQITEALMADPYGRTQFVDSLQYDWIAPDSVQVTATIVGIEDATIDITVNLSSN